MHTVIDSLLDAVEADPLPAAHISSHWQRYGHETLVRRDGDQLVLHASGFETVHRGSFAGRCAAVIEGLSYHAVTASLKHYQAIRRQAQRLTRDLSGSLTFNVFKSAAALAVLADHWEAYGLAPRTFALIGDGYGFLGALIRRYLQGPRLYCMDLPKMLVFQAHTHELAQPHATMSMLGAPPTGERLTDIVFVRPQDLELIPEKIDCAINIASMQEMNEHSRLSYFAFLRRCSTRHSRFYCVNRLEKTLCGGEVNRFYDYPWHERDEIFMDGPCPYYTHFVAPCTRSNGPRRWGIRIPFVNYFDGPMKHRLVRLAPE